jgi:two-component system sensor kinase FixL
VAICLKDLQGRFQLVNREFEEFFRVNNTELQNKTVFALFPRDKAEIFHANDLLAIELRKEIESEEVLEHDGDLRTLKSNRFPLLRPDGNPYAVVGIFVDITESRQKDVALSMLRRQVWHTDRVLSTGAIAGSLAHELSQPLSAILNNAQAGLRFMNSERIDLDEIREILHDIVRDDKRAGAVINGLRSMLQQRESPFAIVDLAQCIEGVIEILHSEFVRLNIVVEQKLESKLSIYADKTQIQQVILNLIVNALEAMAMQETDARTLRIIASHDDGKVVISVRDSGTGIPEDKLDRIFEGFFTTKPQGLGVGLEVCRSIIKSHRGKIWAENNKDQGATFHIILPIAPEAETPADPAYA